MSEPARIAMEPAFVEGRAGRLFSLRLSPAAGPSRGGILYLHPYGEEMHKSRHMAALQARRLAAGGWTVLQFDHYGCGDSEGDAGDARWDIWLDDARSMLRRLHDVAPPPFVLWGLRLGGSLAAALATQGDTNALLLWQPVVNGEQYLNHLLRLKLAGDLVKAGRGGLSTSVLRDRLARGDSLEIAGNRLAPELAFAIGQFSLPAHLPACPAIWLEMGTPSPQALSASSARCAARWQAAGTPLLARSVAGPDFWQTQEIQECPALIEATSAALAEVAA